MNKRERAVKHLQECVDYLNGDSKRRLWVFVRGDVVRASLELLKDLEPVKAVFVGDGSYKCKKCGETVGWDELEAIGIGKVRCRYCPECGKRVKWDG